MNGPGSSNPSVIGALVGAVAAFGLFVPARLRAFAWTHVPGAFCQPDADERDINRGSWINSRSSTTWFYCAVHGAPPSAQRVDGSTITEGHVRVYDGSSSVGFEAYLCLSANGQTFTYYCGTQDTTTTSFTGYDTLILPRPTGTFNSASSIYFRVKAPPWSYITAYSAIDDS